MKKITILSFAIILTFSLNTIFARAQDTATSTQNSKKIDIQNQRDTILSQIQTMRDATKQKMEDLKTQIKNGKNKAQVKIKTARIAGREDILNKFDEKISNINNLKDKINEQIKKMDAKNIETTDAKNFVSDSETKLTIAQGKVTEISALFVGSADILSTENKTKLKQYTIDAQNAIKDAHTALAKAVQSLKNKVVNTDTEVENQNVNTTTNTDSQPNPTPDNSSNVDLYIDLSEHFCLK